MAQNESNAQKGPISVPDSGDYSKLGKGKMIADLLKRCVDVEDLAAERISLPACLVEPVPNLEYWCYLDRPDLFVAINDSEDQLQRMLSIIRFCFSKDLKLAKGEPFKPYDSFRGEFFRAHFDVPANAVSFASTDSSVVPLFSWHLDKAETAPSPVILPRNGHFGAKSPRSTSAGVKENDGPSGRPRARRVRLHTPSDSDEPHTPVDPGIHHRVVFLKEKISDNPSISAYWFECLKKGVEASGVDHISASTNLSGSTIEVVPGSQNKGIFLRIKKGPGSGESYRITHPRGVIKGFSSGHASVVITDSTIITCSGGQGKQLQTIIEYKDLPSSNPPKFEVEGIVFAYEEGLEHEAWAEVSQVPKDLVVATFEGCWKGAITWKRPDSDGTWPLIDLSQLAVVPKQVRRLRDQHRKESRRFWDAVTTNILDENFSEATKTKQAIEQEHQVLSKTRKQFGIRSDPRYFESDISSGVPTLSFEGRRVLTEETHIFHESPASSTEESPIEQPHKPALAKSRKNLVGALKKMFTGRKKWTKREEKRKDSIEDDRNPLPRRKKKRGLKLRKRGSGSGSGSGSGELSYTVSRSSGSGELACSGGEFARKYAREEYAREEYARGEYARGDIAREEVPLGLSRNGSRSSWGDNQSVFEPPNYSERESHPKPRSKATNRLNDSWSQGVGQPPRPGATDSPPTHNRDFSIPNSPDSYSDASSSSESMPDSTNEVQRLAGGSGMGRIVTPSRGAQNSDGFEHRRTFRSLFSPESRASSHSSRLYGTMGATKWPRIEDHFSFQQKPNFRSNRDGKASSLSPNALPSTSSNLGSGLSGMDLAEYRDKLTQDFSFRATPHRHPSSSYGGSGLGRKDMVEEEARAKTIEDKDEARLQTSGDEEKERFNTMTEEEREERKAILARRQASFEARWSRGREGSQS